MKVLYEGTDISKEVYINRCEHETFAEKRADRLMIRFVDSSGLWSKWGPKSGDKIRFINDAADTGDMYVTEIHPTNGLITFYATALPITGKTKKSRVWENFRLLQIAEDIASEHGLKFKSYDVTDRAYAYIRQERQSDFDFLQARCLLEGCAMTVYDGTLIVYDEQKREQAQATTTFKIGDDGVFEYCDQSAQAYSSAEVVSGKYRGACYDQSVATGLVLRPTHEIPCASDAEALRFARGILRDANKLQYTGAFRRRLTCDYAAASVARIETSKAEMWNGKVFITRTRMDHVRGEIKVFFRRMLEGY